MEYNDIKQKYATSWFAFKNGPKFKALAQGLASKLEDEQSWIPATTPALSGEGPIVRFTCGFKENNQYRMGNVLIKWNPDFYEDEEFIFNKVPILGMVNAGDGIIYLTQNPVQDQARGYCPNHIYDKILNPNLYRNFGHPCPQKASLAVVSSVYNHFYYMYSDAVAQLNNGLRVGCALSQYLGIVLEVGKRAPLLFHRSDCIGRITDGIPIVRAGTSPAIVDYVQKITGIQPSFR